MKKIVSLMALCAVLLGAVMMVTGCGSKPAKGSVWEVTSGIPETVKAILGKDAGVYVCFHTNGKAYYATKALNVLGATELGEYSIEKDTITIGKVSCKYTLKGETMTIQGFEIMKAVKVDLNLRKVASPTEKQIKDVVK